MRDLPSSRDLLTLARELLLNELLPLLPPERERDARLIATVISIAAREAGAREMWQGDLAEMLAAFYANAAPTPTLPRLRGREPPVPADDSPSPASGEGSGWGLSDVSHPQDLLTRFAADLRKGAFETSPSREKAARAILWRLTIGKLREANPHFLAANGFRNADGQGS
jgi:hypothetical protein